MKIKHWDIVLIAVAVVISTIQSFRLLPYMISGLLGIMLILAFLVCRVIERKARRK